MPSELFGLQASTFGTKNFCTKEGGTRKAWIRVEEINKLRIMKQSGKKLTLKKEKIASLSGKEMSTVKGGGGSTKHKFTCGLCTSTHTKEATCAATCHQATCSIMTGPCLPGFE